MPQVAALFGAQLGAHVRRHPRSGFGGRCHGALPDRRGHPSRIVNMVGHFHSVKRGWPGRDPGNRYPAPPDRAYPGPYPPARTDEVPTMDATLPGDGRAVIGASFELLEHL